MKKTFVVAVALTFLLSGCAWVKANLLGQREHTKQCDIGPVMVHVPNNQITAIPNIGVTGQEKWICWQLDEVAAKTYEFQTGSIQIDDKGHKAFANCKKGDKDGTLDGKDRILCKDNNPRKDQYKYTIKVYLQNGTDGPELDPMIDNN
jgi:hypothetical protein